jgi:hypothetical protein
LKRIFRKLFPDNSPGPHTDDKLRDDVWGEISAYEEKWGAFFDHADSFKNPKPMAWKFDPWRDHFDDEWDEKYERS